MTNPIALHHVHGTKVYWEAMPPTLAELGRDFVGLESWKIAVDFPVEEYLADAKEDDKVLTICVEYQGLKALISFIWDHPKTNSLVLSWDHYHTPRDGQNRFSVPMIPTKKEVRHDR